MANLPESNKYAAKVPPQGNGLELYLDHATTAYRLRLTGLAFNLNVAAKQAIEFTLAAKSTTRENDGRRKPPPRNFLASVSAKLSRSSGAGLNAMADDKAWPMFWSAFHSAQNPAYPLQSYTKDNAGEAVKAFKASHGLSNADWKWLCRQDHWYLYNYYETPPPYNIRWPRDCVETDVKSLFGQPQFRDLVPWMRDYFRNDFDTRAPEAPDFRQRMSDYNDVHAQMSPEEKARILRSKNFTELFSRIQEVEDRLGRNFNMDLGPGGRNFVYGVSPGRRATIDMEAYTRHLVQQLGISPSFLRDADPRFQIDPAINIDATEARRRHDEQLAIYGQAMSRVDAIDTSAELGWVNKFPKTGTVGPIDYVLLDTLQKVLDEGQKMQHCLGRLYAPHIYSGRYIAYHLSYADQGLRKPSGGGWRDGYTMGIHRRPDPLNKGVEPTLVVDQIRGFKNSIPNDSALDLCADYLLNEIRKLVKE